MTQRFTPGCQRAALRILERMKDREQPAATAGELAEIIAEQTAAPEMEEALSAVDGQINETGRYYEPPDAYAEIPWKTVDLIRVALAQAAGKKDPGS